MKAEELRIGNYVHEPSYDECFNTYVIKQIQTRGVSVSVLGKDIQGLYDYEDLKPIPLTEEWLLKFGLNLTDWFYENSYKITKDKEYGWSMMVRNANHTTKIEFSYYKHVHQLQNLYFALCGEELIIDNNSSLSLVKDDKGFYI